MIRGVVLAVTMALLLSCTTNQDSSQGVEVIDVDLQNESKPNAKLVNVVPLESSAEALIGNAMLALSPKYYVVGNSRKSIMVFTRDGKFISKFDPRGRSMSEVECSYIDHFQVRDDVISVVDSGRGRVCRYSISGEFLGAESSMEGFNFQFVESSTLFAVDSHAGMDTDKAMVVYNKKSGEHREHFERVLDNISLQNLFVDDDRIYCQPPFDLTIYEVEESLEVTPRYRFDMGRIWMSVSDAKGAGNSVQDMFDKAHSTNTIFQCDVNKQGRWLTLSFRYNSVTYTCFYDTQTQKQYMSTFSRDDLEDLNFQPIVAYSCSDEGGFYTVMPAEYFVKIFGEDNEYGVKEEDNPVIMQYQIEV